jgi:light-harvesting complex 1 beta chain
MTIPSREGVRGEATNLLPEGRSMATLSGLTEAEAKEFHEQFKTTFTAFLGIAAIAHLLVFAVRPWL